MPAASYRIIEDPKHGYRRVDPTPSNEDFERYYKEEFYSQRYKQFNDSSLQVQLAQKEFFDWRWSDIHRAIRTHLPSQRLTNPSLFDIGCGFCQSLLYFNQRGFRVAGLELAQEAVDYGKSQGIEVTLGSVDDLHRISSTFDVILMIDVLEHVPHPEAALLGIRRLLVPDGLLIIDVPNDFNDLQVAADEVYSLNQWWVCPPNHVNYFSVPSLQRLTADCGYRMLQCETTFPLEMFLLMGDVYVGNPELGAACHAKRVTFERLLRNSGREETLHRLYRALAEAGIGRQIVMVCRPQP